MSLVFILCVKRQLESLVDEMQDWKEEGANVFLYGVTDKANEGFIILEWGKPVPERFSKKLREDPDIVDFVVFGKNIPPADLPASTLPA
jgi:hypothetical protein